MVIRATPETSEQLQKRIDTYMLALRKPPKDLTYNYLQFMLDEINDARGIPTSSYGVEPKGIVAVVEADGGDMLFIQGSSRTAFIYVSGWEDFKKE
jgi:hypothetical protein